MTYITRTPTRCAGCGQHQGVPHLAPCPYRGFCIKLIKEVPNHE